MNEPRSYQQTLTIARMARAGGHVSQAELLTMGGNYATNIVAALLQRGLIQSVSPQIWELTDDGRAIARELLGESQP